MSETIKSKATNNGVVAKDVAKTSKKLKLKYHVLLMQMRNLRKIKSLKWRHACLLCKTIQID
jgi:hypothetical protein